MKACFDVTQTSPITETKSQHSHVTDRRTPSPSIISVQGSRRLPAASARRLQSPEYLLTDQGISEGTNSQRPQNMNASTEDMVQPADKEKIEKLLDEELVQAAEKLALLEHIHETLATGLAEQLEREHARLERELRQAADKAARAVQKWKDVQLGQLTHLEHQFPASQAEVCCVQERIKALGIAMQMARQVRRIPFLQQYCSLDKTLETLLAPVDTQSFDMKCITVGSGRSCVFQSHDRNQSLSLSLKMEVSNPKHLSESPPEAPQLGNSNRKPPPEHVEGRTRNELPTPQKPDQERPGASRSWSGGSPPSPRPPGRAHLLRHSSASDLGTPRGALGERLDAGPDHPAPPAGPGLANVAWRLHTRRRDVEQKTNVTMWVEVTHVVNPSHFYVRYVAERRQSETLSKKINRFCCEESCLFTSSDTVETGSMIFVAWTEGLWCRASVLEVLQKGCVEAVKACPATQLARIRVFFLDYGLTKSLTIESEEETTESSLMAVNSHLRKVGDAVNAALGRFAVQAIRCSLKDLVPYDPTEGWSKEAQAAFSSVVGSAAVEMQPLGQDGHSVLVDLRKAPMDQHSDVPVSVREYLVFIEVARFDCPVALGASPLQYYPPVYPKIHAELHAVVSHVSSPADFYIQLVDNMEFLLLSAKLQDCYNKTTAAAEEDLNIHFPVIEQACVARYDDKWYRAQVIGHPGGRKVEVQYVDFGNKSILSVSDLRRIKDEFFVLPSRAVHCGLSDVIPLDGGTWSDACTERFISLAHQKLVTIVATGIGPKTKPLPVRVFKSDLNGPQANIAELLVKEERACFKKGLESKAVSPPCDESAPWDPPPELDFPGEQDEEPLEPRLKLPALLKHVSVRVSHVNSPSSFYVQLTQCDPQLKRLYKLVMQECVNTEPEDVVWKTDMYCAAHIDGVWERGRICSDLTSDNIAEVTRCDHGNMVKLHVRDLRPLPSSLMGSLALECTLTGIRPAGGQSTWTATACELISFCLTGASALMTIKELTDERPVPVTLFCSNRGGQFISIADFLASEGVALRDRKPRDAVVENPREADARSPVSESRPEKKNTRPASAPVSPLPPFSAVSTATSPRAAPRSIRTAKRVKTPWYPPPELPCLGHVQISVSAVGEDGLIYARTPNAERQLEQLRARIQRSMNTLPRQKPHTWKSVVGCAAVGPDKLWYRGQLLEVLGGHVKVQYVDYGRVETVPLVHVYPMLLCDDVPQLCMPCQLHGINPVGGKWQRVAVALLEELLVNRCVDMQVMELPTDPRGPLTVELLLDHLSLGSILCHHEHASMGRTVSAQKGRAVTSAAVFLDDWDIDTEDLKGPEEPMLGPYIYPNLPKQGEQFQVRVKHLWTPNKLFLWPVEGTADAEVEGETLDEALTRINANSNSLPRLTNFPLGGPCLAEYSDGKYYRAKVIKFSSVEPVMILVQHVDFGSDDTLPPSKLRQMPAELLRFQTQALQVKVAGFRAPRATQQDVVLPYSPRWSVKAAMAMIDLLHGNITACVVAREPALSVLLFDEDGELAHLPLVSSGLAELA